MSLKKRWNQFVESFFRLDKRYLSVIVADLLFVTFAVSISQLFALYFQMRAKGITPLAQLAVNVTSTEQIKAYTSSITNLIIVFFVFAFVYVFLLFASWTASQGFIWNIINKRPHTFKYYKKLFLMNLFLVPLYAVLFLLFSVLTGVLQLFFSTAVVGFTQNSMLTSFLIMLASVFVVTPLLMYVLNSFFLIYYNFSTTHMIKKSFGLMFGQLAKLRYVPVFFMSAILVLLSMLATVFGNYSIIALGILLLLSVAWLRFYLKDIVEA